MFQFSVRRAVPLVASVGEPAAGHEGNWVDCNGVTPTFAPKFTLTVLSKTICVEAYANVMVMRANATNNGMYRLLNILLNHTFPLPKARGYPQVYCSTLA